jgi:hypothetical protein
MSANTKFCGRTDFGHWISHAPTFLDMLPKRSLKWRQHLAGRPRRWGRSAPLWLGWPGFYATSSHRVIFSVTMPILDLFKICMDFGPYDAFPSSDVAEMVDQQNSWNSLVISTYLLYLEWNGCLLALNIYILWPPTSGQFLGLILIWDIFVVFTFILNDMSCKNVNNDQWGKQGR